MQILFGAVVVVEKKDIGQMEEGTDSIQLLLIYRNRFTRPM